MNRNTMQHNWKYINQVAGCQTGWSPCENKQTNKHTWWWWWWWWFSLWNQLPDLFDEPLEIQSHSLSPHFTHHHHHDSRHLSLPRSSTPDSKLTCSTISSTSDCLTPPTRLTSRYAISSDYYSSSFLCSFSSFIIFKKIRWRMVWTLKKQVH